MNNENKLTPKQAAAAFAAKAKELGFRFEANMNRVAITKLITPGSREEFANADMSYDSVLGLAPLRGGSVWGTDGGSVGGMSALNSGQFRMNKSGTGANFLKALIALQSKQ